MSPRIKKIAKWSLAIALLLVLFLLGSFFFIISKLPTPSEINQAIQSPQESSNTTSTPPLAIPHRARHGIAIGEPHPSQPTPPAERKTQKQINNDYFFKRFVDSNDTTVHVCDNLDQPSKGPENAQDFGDIFADVATNKKSADPYLESILAPINAIIKVPAMQSILEELKAAPTDDPSFFRKAGFYAKFAQAGIEIWNNKTEIEQVSDHAYHLYILTKAIHKNPGLAQDKSTLDFCNQIQNNIEFGNAEALEKERADMNQFLNYAGVTAKDVGYDPDYRTEIMIKKSESKFQVSIGWIDNVLQGKMK